jgi:hypothetical protein
VAIVALNTSLLAVWQRRRHKICHALESSDQRKTLTERTPSSERSAITGLPLKQEFGISTLRDSFAKAAWPHAVSAS